MRSLQGKIVLVYLALAALALGLLGMALVELSLMTDRVRAGSLVAEFFDTTLEIRRFEKNHFLYAQAHDLDENARYVELARALLRRDPGRFAGLAGTASAARLDAGLGEYARLMAAHAKAPADETLAVAVRAQGKHLVEQAERLAALERQSLSDALDTYRRNLLISVAVVLGLLVLAGILLARSVARPLQAMERRMQAIAEGQLARMDTAFKERELVGLTQAFNHVLDELERRQHTLVRAEKLASLGTLLSGVAHELNNPLSNISSSAQILVESGDDDPEFRRQLIADIDQETRRAAKIVRSLLDYARDRDFQRQPVNLAELLDETLRFLKSRRAPGIEVRMEVPADLVVPADRPRLQQALLNLIGNALEAMGDYGELSVDARRAVAGSGAEGVFPALTGSCRTGTPVIDIRVGDTGPGIPRAILSRIFDPFFTTKPVGQGNGLGLFIVHEIVEEHGGCIGVENLAEGGARFHIRLPAIEPAAPAHPASPLLFPLPSEASEKEPS